MVNAGRPVAVGGDAVRVALEEAMAVEGMEVSAWRVAAGLHHVRLGWTLVAYTSRMPDGSSHTGHYLATWHQHPDGTWSIVSYASASDPA